MKIGILGAGQLGRMLALSGSPLGLRFLFLDPGEQPCAADVGPVIRAAYDDPAALDDLCAACDVVTYEFENIPRAAADALAARRPLHPAPAALAESQDRGREKALFDRLGIPVAPYRLVDSEADLRQAVVALGLPAVLKTRRFGYDGKGQRVLRQSSDLAHAWQALGGHPLILEAFVPFEREVSCVGVRRAGGELRFYPIATNEHRDGILRCSRPLLGDPLQTLAEHYTRQVMEALDYVGVMAFEFFVRDGGLLANEIAPRVHNSGHWTQDGALCSQFENHLRALLDWPLGDTGLRQPTAMLNLIGGHPPAAALVASDPGLRLHLYGKTAQPGRKIGHVNLCAATPAALDAQLAGLRPLIDAAAVG